MRDIVSLTVLSSPLMCWATRLHLWLTKNYCNVI